MKLRKFFHKLAVAKVDDEQGNFATYINALESGKFKHKMFYGVGEKVRGFITTDPLQNPGALYIGGMGSGKSVAMRTTLVTNICANSEDTVYILMDPLKGMTDYSCLFHLKENVAYTVNDPAKIVTVIEMLYKEVTARKNEFSRDGIQASNIAEYNALMKKNGSNEKPLARIIFCIEEFHAIPNAKEVKFHMNVDRPGSVAYKLKELQRVGRSYGVQMMAATQRATTDDVPSTLKAGLSQMMAFRVNNPGDATAANLPEAADIRKEQKGKCATQDGFVQFPYIDDETVSHLLEKYYKPLNARMLMYNMDHFHQAFDGDGNSGMTKINPLKELIEFANQFDFGDIVTRYLKEFDYTVEKVEDEALGISLIASKNGEKYAVYAISGSEQSTPKYVQKFKNGMQMLGLSKIIAITLERSVPKQVEILADSCKGSFSLDKEDMVDIAEVLDNKDQLIENGRFETLYNRLVLVESEEEIEEDDEEEEVIKPIKTKTGGAQALADLREQLKQEIHGKS